MDEPHAKPVLVRRGTDLPPPAPGIRYVALPPAGIVIADDVLRSRVDRFFHWPMIVLALAILPLLIVEVLQKPGWLLGWPVDTGFAVIWFAFLVEFLIKITISEARIEYVRRNWLDVIIILVPVLRLVRPLRAASAVGRTTRVFKLRGVGMKLARHLFSIIIGLEATDRLLHRIGLKKKAQTRKEPGAMTRYELMDEVSRLRRMNDGWESWHAAHEEYVARHGGACYVAPKPEEPDAAAEGSAPPASADPGPAANA